MLLNINNLRVRIGLTSTDASNDAAITAAYGTAEALAEAYCDRKFAFATDREKFVHHGGSTLSLRRYPIVTLISINDTKGNASSVTHHDDFAKGLIQFDGYNGEHELTVNYDGGYTATTAPLDLALALSLIFDETYKLRGGGAGGTAAAGGIKTVRAGDLSITYDGAAGASSGSSGYGGGIIPANALNILDSYSRKSA